MRPSVFIFNPKSPALLDVRVRPSSVAPGRFKVGFTTDLAQGATLIGSSGEEHQIDPKDAGKTMMLGDEFRLEMN